MALTTEKGRLFFKGEVKSGVSKAGIQWQAQTIVVETSDAPGYSRKIAIKAFGDQVQQLESIKVGEDVEVRYKVAARDYNGNWYNDVSLYSIAIIQMPLRRPVVVEQEPSVFDPDAHPDDMPF